MPRPDPQSVTQQARAIRRRIGLNLHLARHDRRMAMDKLSTLSGIPPRLIDQIELGKGDADLHMILRLCAALSVDFTKLVA